jgi:Flp pilus assembly protein TadD
VTRRGGGGRNAAARGLDLHRAGRLAEAEAAYRDALRRAPRDGEVMHLLGVLQHQSGRVSEAAETLRAAARLRPGHPETLRVLGVALAGAGRLAEAARALEDAARAAPGSATIRSDLATALTRLADAGEGDVLALRRRARDAAPELPWTWLNLGNALSAAGRTGEAEAALREGLRRDPGDPEIRLSLAGALFDLEREEEAVAEYRSALRRVPGDVRALIGLGASLRRLDRHDEAAEAYREALERAPRDPRVLMNLGGLHADAGRTAEAVSCFDRGLDLAPGMADLRVARGRERLVLGDFAGGWADMEWRWDAREAGEPRGRHPQPDWDGAPPPGRLLVWAEQGPGDQILYGTMLPDLLAAGVRCLVEAEPRLVPLFLRSLPGAEVVPRTDPPRPETRAPDIAAQVPFAGLGRFLRTAPEAFLGRGAYLAPDPALRDALRRRYRDLAGGGPAIGVSWRSARHKMARRKSVALADLAPVLRLPGAVAVDLQYGDTADERAALAEASGLRVFRDPGIDPLRDLDGFAAQVAALDAVVTTSNTAAHVAGALGIPTWLLAPPPSAAFWYWRHPGDRSLWYPSVRVLRRPPSGPDRRAEAAAGEIADLLAVGAGAPVSADR